MDARVRQHSSFGAVAICIISPTRVALVRQKFRCNPLWKFPCGSIEGTDAGVGETKVIIAAIREAEEETGIPLDPKEIRVCFVEKSDRDGYWPYFCVAEISEAKMDTHADETSDDGEELEVKTFMHGQLWTMRDIPRKHRVFLEKLSAAAA